MRISRIAVVAVAALATTLCTGTPAPAQTAPSLLRVATFNAFMLPQLLLPSWNPMTRADLISSHGLLAGQDVVVLQEVFDNEASQRLMGNLAPSYPHQTPVVGRSSSGWNSTSGPFLWQWRPEDGGVAILSRWPITHRSQQIYYSSCGTDGLSAKGFAYARITMPGPSTLHVIGTHNQADDGMCLFDTPAAVRAEQHREIAAFVRSSGIPASEPVIIAGDLNVDRRSPEYQAMLTNLNVSAPGSYSGHPHSYDPASNSITADSGEPSQHLDYVLLANDHASPAGPGWRWINSTSARHSPPWQVTQFFQTYTFTDYSDHYPVFGALTYQGRRG